MIVKRINTTQNRNVKSVFVRNNCNAECDVVIATVGQLIFNGYVLVCLELLKLFSKICT